MVTRGKNRCFLRMLGASPSAHLSGTFMIQSGEIWTQLFVILHPQKHLVLNVAPPKKTHLRIRLMEALHQPQRQRDLQ